MIAMDKQDLFFRYNIFELANRVSTLFGCWFLVEKALFIFSKPSLNNEHIVQNV